MSSKRTITAAFAACLFLLIVGAKWSTFGRYGSAMPDWDQWDAEAVELFIPWFEHDHFVAHLFHPHNEHRVVLTKLQNLALGLLNGEWDSRVEATTNALLHAALGAAFWVCAANWIRRRPIANTSNRAVAGDAAVTHASAARPIFGAAEFVCATGLFLLVAALFALPLAWQNILGGFHSQQYWLLGLSFAAIVVLPFGPARRPAWWLAALAAVLALGSMGSGFLAAAVVLVVVGWRLWRRSASWSVAWPSIVLCVALVVVGAATRVEVPWHQDLKARTVHDFVFSVIHSLEWPLRDNDWAAAVLWLPWLVVGWRLLRLGRRTAAMVDEPNAHCIRGAETIVALGGWVFVQVLATAYARGVGADYPASRYMDTLAFGALVNGAAVAWLLTARDGVADGASKARRTGWTVALVAVAVGWTATLAYGLREVTQRNLRYELPDARKYYDKAEGHMRRYLGTNDPKQLAFPDIPFPSAEGLIERLAKPSLRALVPAPIRAPLAMVPAAAAPAFRENDGRRADPVNPPRAGLSPQTPPLDFTRTWGSFNADGRGAGETGTWRSAPITPTLRGWLKFETAGQVGDPNDGVSLELRDAQTDALIRRVRPDHMPGDTWRAAYVPTPAKPFVVVAEDRHAARWLAFSGPVEMGPLSYWAWRATKYGDLMMYAALALIAAVSAYAVVRRRGLRD